MMPVFSILQQNEQSILKLKFKLYKSHVTSILFHGCETWTLLADSEKKDPGLRSEETSPHLLLRAQDQRLGAEQDQLPCGSTGTSSGNCHETETCAVRGCYTPQQSPKPSFRASWRVSDAVVGRRNAGWTTSGSVHPCQCQNCSHELPAEKTGRGSLLSCPSFPATTQSVKGLNC